MNSSTQRKLKHLVAGTKELRAVESPTSCQDNEVLFKKKKSYFIGQFISSVQKVKTIEDRDD